MATLLTLLGYSEVTANVFFGVVDVDPRGTGGLHAGIGSIVTDALGNQYRKTGSGDTAWTIVDVSTAGSPNDVAELEGAGAPTNGSSGTGNGTAGKGSRYTDFTNGILYLNTGTKASPTWAAVTTA